MGKNTDIANAVVGQLAAGNWPLAFRPRVVRDLILEMEELAELQVSVVPNARTLRLEDRSATQAAYHVAVGVQQATSDPAVQDALIDLAERIADFFVGRRMATVPEALCTAAEHVPLYSVEHLRSYGVLTSVVMLTFERYETIARP